MYNYNTILLIAVEMLDLDLKSFGLSESVQKNRFKKSLDITENKVCEIKNKILKELYKNLKSKELVIVFENMISEYLSLISDLKKDLDLKAEDDLKRINWIFLRRFFIPYLAISFANFDSKYENRKDKGLSGGRFWYLPDLTVEKKKLDLPLSYMVKWWKDLCGKGLGSISNEIDELLGEDGPISGVENTIKSWTKTDSAPRRNLLMKYLNKDISYEGCFSVNKELSLHKKFNKAKEFVCNIKQLDLNNILHELPDETLIRKIYINKKQTDSNKKQFLNLVMDRWKKPSKRTLVSRFMIARSIHYSWNKLHKYFDIKKANNKDENPLLQLVILYQSVYNLEIIRHMYGQYPDNMDIFISSRYIHPLIYIKKQKSIENKGKYLGYLKSEMRDEFNYMKKENKITFPIYEALMNFHSENSRNKESVYCLKEYVLMLNLMNDSYMERYPDLKENIQFIKDII